MFDLSHKGFKTLPKNNQSCTYTNKHTLERASIFNLSSSLSVWVTSGKIKSGREVTVAFPISILAALNREELLKIKNLFHKCSGKYLAFSGQFIWF